jgi:hypothetical protein
MSALSLGRFRKPGATGGDGVLLVGLLAASSLITFALAVRGPQQTVLLIAASLAIFALALLVVSPRYEVSLAIFIVYLGVLDGYLKLKSGSQSVALGRDVLLYAIAAGALIRLSVGKRVHFPPYTGWIVAFVAVCLVQLANPHNHSLLHALGGLRPHLEFVPLFFLGYAVMRSAKRLRVFLILLLAVTAINGAVALYQYQLTPAQLASWGPGYSRLINGFGAIAARVSYNPNQAQATHVRPFGLGSDTGFSGNLAALAAPAAIALLVLRRRVARGISVALAGSVVVALVASQARVSLIGAAFSVIAFTALSTASRRRLRVILGIATVVVISWFAVSIVATNIGAQVFQRYQSIAPSRVVSTSINYKRSSFSALGTYLVKYPLGAGLGTSGPASTFANNSLRDLNAENEFNFLILELGYPGLLLLCGFCIQMCLLVAFNIKRIADPELRPLLTALGAAVIGTFATFAGGPILSGSPGAPFFWFACGTLVYWLASPSGHVPRFARPTRA